MSNSDEKWNKAIMELKTNELNFQEISSCGITTNS